MKLRRRKSVLRRMAGIPAGTIQDSILQTCDTDLIQRHVFACGLLASPRVLKSIGAQFSVPVIRGRVFGQDYAKTLPNWRSKHSSAKAASTLSGGDLGSLPDLTIPARFSAYDHK
jgi:cyclopropane-fatty-acyl-phospholipid synthase